MSHLLGESDVAMGWYPPPHYMAACVRLVAKRPRLVLEVTGKLMGVKVDVQIAELPDHVLVVGSDGEDLCASFGFYISTETIDPIHWLLDVDRKRLRRIF